MFSPSFMKVLTRITSTTPAGHPTRTIFEIVQVMIWTNLLTKFNEDRTRNGDYREQELSEDSALDYSNIIGKNLLTKFHDDRTINVEKCPCFSTNQNHFRPHPRYHWHTFLTKFHEDLTKNVASRVFLLYPYNASWKPCFSSNRNHFKLFQDIIGTHLLTEFHEDLTKMWPIVLTRQILTPHDGQRHSQKHTISTLCSGEPKIFTILKVEYL
ncbi:hypothetical protein DPMN_089041 [Dreissena polymorpha]|uniref:Uncharacterized protein n=1 Tax=Dreissena polymorpha TaxID=45954 RepID=A0A9D4KW32_DREPO|nr:hypothetical protein DPMN_089041 [Dreissena polymorpha]